MSRRVAEGSRWSRRGLLALAGGGLAGVAGCVEGDTTPDDGSASTPTPTPTPTPADLPSGIYVQEFQETMAMQGTAQAGDYAVGLMYAAPHPFWTLTGSERSFHERSGSIHLMAVVWDPKTETVVPETGLSVTILQGDELVSQEVIYPMLSQRMGFHYGANFALAGDGEYTAEVEVGALPIRRTGSYRGRFSESVTADVGFAFNEEQRSRVKSRKLDAYGEPGAVKPMDMEMMPQAYAPKASALPGEVVGRTRTDGAVFVATRLDSPPAGVDGEGYLAVSARTRYNRLVLPAMALSATVERGGETVYEGPLTRTFDPELNYHYGAATSLQSGDEVTLDVQTVPQVARHVGYERAFLQMEPTSFTV